MEYRKHYNKDGFTLTEILIAIAIVAIMAVAGWQIGTRYLRQARMTKTKATLETLSNEITQFNVDTTQYPARLRDLVKRPEDETIANKWQGPYVPREDLLIDPWGNQYQYQVTSGQEHPYELFSFGPNGRGAPKAEHISVWNI